MKKILLMAAFCIAAVSCNHTSMIQGVFSDENVNDTTLIAIATDRLLDVSDTCAVVDGKFQFEYPASDTTTLWLRITSTDSQRARDLRSCRTVVFPSEGTVSVFISKDSTSVTGGVLNDAYVAYEEERQALRKESSERRKAILEQFAEGSEEFQNALAELRKDNDAKRFDLSKKTVEVNKDNAFGALILNNMLDNHMLTSAEVDEILADASDFLKNEKDIATSYKYLVNTENTAIGKMFVDFEGKTPSGEPVKLSDFVGKGNYVLMDFWASWCGFCIQEFPNIKEVYEKYADKGLTVVGVCISDGDNSASRKVLEKYDAKWNQIFLGDGNEPAVMYGVRGIPHIMIFNPDGTVMVRDLRGQKIIDTVAGLYE